MKNHYIALVAACLPLAAWADASFTSGINTQATVSGNVTVSGKTELHLTSNDAPLTPGTSVNLVDDNSWLFFNAVRPSDVVENFLPMVKIKGAPAVLSNTGNVRVTVWGSGTVVIPNGNLTDLNALTVYDGINCTGNSTSFGCRDILGNNTHRVGLDTIASWDNKIKSFTLKRGYMATFANNPDGTGHSRVWIADEDDVVVSIMPDGFVTYNGSNNTYDDANTQSFISFLRVSPWRWVSKKGWGGWSNYEIALSSVDTYYVWLDSQHWEDDADNDFYPINYEFVPIKQNNTDPKWYQLDTITNVSHLLAYNEPDRPDQSNLSVDQVIRQWPNLFRTGLRLGSPACSSIWTDWDNKFWKQIIKYNYRCDFAVTHIYEYTTDWASRYNKAKSLSNGRPFWVTEYNNGANWTTETNWPTAKGTKVDVHGNPILDKNGNQQTVNRPASAANLEHQRQWTVKIMDIIEKMDGLERGYYYNWVEDARSYILNGELTPAGKVFANYVSAPGYKASAAYNHTWKIAPPYPIFIYSADQKSVTCNLYDHNGETGREYVVEAFTTNGWVEAGRVAFGTDYQPNEYAKLTVAVPEGVTSPVFRAYAISYKGQKSEYSDEKSPITQTLVAPSLRLEARNGDVVKLAWNEISDADYYRLKRGTKSNQINSIIAGNITETSYTDTKVTEKTEYWYQLASKNAFNDFKWGSPLRVYTGTKDAGVEVVVEKAMTVYTEGHNIIVECDVPATISIASIDGRLIRNIEAEAGTTTISDLHPGIYIVNDDKVVVR